MRTNLIVLLPPLFDNDLGLLQSVEDFTIEQLIPEFTIEALDKAIFPRAAWFDEQGLDRQLVQPGADLLVGKFGAII